MGAETVRDNRPDLDADVAVHYGCEVPVLAVGDTVIVHRDKHTIIGFAAGGMLVVSQRHADKQVFHYPRRMDPGGFIEAAEDDPPCVVGEHIRFEGPSGPYCGKCKVDLR